jgi:alanine racemase
MEMYRRTFAEINLDHLAHNFEAIRQALPEAPFLCPMVKANAYGHGDVAVALCLEKSGVKHLGVCLVEEGLALRAGGVKTAVLVFRGFDRSGAAAMIEAKLTPVISTWDQLDTLETELKSRAGSALQIHLKFNTGMNRLGFQPNEAQKVFDRCWQNKWVRVQGILTHLYNGEEAGDPASSSADQLRNLSRVGEIFKPLQPLMHSLNSSGILNAVALRKNPAAALNQHPLTNISWGLRPGLMLYGFNPTAMKDVVSLKPVMTLRSEAANFREVQDGETVSYGGTWKATKKSVIAVVPIGYADGYHRILSNKAEVLFRGQRVPIVGNICMDFLMIDITKQVQGEDIHALRSEDVVLFGEASDGTLLSAEELAVKAQTISWEILTSVGARVPRVYTGEWAKKLGVAL